MSLPAAAQSSFADEEQNRTFVRLHGTLWSQTALEREVACTQAYRLAKMQLAHALKDQSWTAALEQAKGYEGLPPAIILDVDETVLDNSAFQARLVDRDIDFDIEHWRQWVREKKADPMPGAKDFFDFAESKRVPLFFVTNREFQVEDATVQNLCEVLKMEVTKAQVLCKMEQPDWGSDKTSRRSFLAKSYRILLLIGDDFNDFAFLGKAKPRDRVKKGCQYKAWWGTRWIQLPNPIYGNWEKALYDYDFALPKAVKLRLKLDALETKEDANQDAPILRTHH
jgi:5'-nucleotidase (lipoprotein e(P4) family)